MQDVTPKPYVVITSINEYTEALRAWASRNDVHILYVADKKSPVLTSIDNVTVLGLQEQERLEFRTVQRCPFNHYARKNIGYLYAMAQGATTIVDTDDDNMPGRNWTLRFDSELASPIRYVTRSDGESNHVNIYSHFTSLFVWPRGLPLNAVRQKGRVNVRRFPASGVAVWQGLVNGDPDVDAIYRLLYGPDIAVEFNSKPHTVLGHGVYCPFNSQNTIWAKSGFSLMYLPAFVSFRFTDILRSYITQRCLWAAGLNLGFTTATALQLRNPHNLLQDFESEIPCYLNSENVARIIDDLNLSGDSVKDQRKCYEALCSEGIVQKVELELLEDWTADIRTILKL